jgi:hypothetical protein
MKAAGFVRRLFFWAPPPRPDLAIAGLKTII